MLRKYYKLVYWRMGEGGCYGSIMSWYTGGWGRGNAMEVL